MQFIIFQNDLRKYFTNNGKVIVFIDEQEARQFANTFYQNYAIPNAMAEAFTNPQFIAIVMKASQSWVIQELPEKYDYEIIDFAKLKDKR